MKWGPRLLRFIAFPCSFSPSGVHMEVMAGSMLQFHTPRGAEEGLADADLLQRFVKARDDAAFAQVVARHAAAIQRTAMLEVGRAAAAADVAQAAFIVMARRPRPALRSARRQGSALPWLTKVTRYTAANWRRTEARRRRREHAAARPERVDADPSQGPDLAEAVTTALRGLGRRDRQLVTLRHVEELSWHEVAQQTGTTPDAARMATERAMTRLREVLERNGVTASAAVIGMNVLHGSPSILGGGATAASFELASGALLMLKAKTVALAAGVALLVGAGGIGAVVSARPTSSTSTPAFIKGAVALDDAQPRIMDLRQVAIQQLSPAVPHRYDAVALNGGSDWRLIRWNGKLPFDGHLSEHNIHPDGRYRVISQVWQQEKNEQPRSTLQKQATWNGDQSFLVQKSVSGTGALIIAAGDEADNGLNAIASTTHATVFDGFSRSFGSTLALLLRDASASAYSYSRGDGKEELSLPLAGGHLTLKFSGERLVGWVVRWGEGDILNGELLPRRAFVDTLNEDRLLAVTEEVRFGEFRETELGVELPHALAVETLYDLRNGGRKGGRVEARRRGIEKLRNAGGADFSPVGIPVGHPVEPFDSEDETRYVWSGTSATKDGGNPRGADAGETLAGQGGTDAEGSATSRPVSFLSNRYVLVLGGVVLVAMGVFLVVRRRRMEMVP